MKKTFVLDIILILFSGIVFAAFNEPVVLLIKPEGNVLYKNKDNKWKKINRTKFLFQGYEVKTGINGNCILINYENNQQSQMIENTTIKIIDSGIAIVKGDLKDKSNGEGIISNLKKKYMHVQQYAVVMRSANTVRNVKLLTAQNVVISKSFPYLVWENIGPIYSYCININDKKYDILGTERDMIRFKVPLLEPGEYQYFVEVKYKDKIIYKPRKKCTLTWLSDEENNEISKKIESIKKINKDLFLIANLLDDLNLYVPAMDNYHKYFQDNQLANDMRPFLIKVYSELKMKNLKKRLSQLYQSHVD